MPVKKTTTKKTTTKKPATKKPMIKVPVKKASLSNVSNTTAVIKKAESCGTSCYGSVSTRTLLLLIANTILLVFMITSFNTKKALVDMEIQRVGGIENYETIQKIYELDTFKQQQKFQIEQTYQALQGMGQGMMLPEDMELIVE